ncbi:MAG: flavin reductase family protein [Ostreibacterium sp.]
MNIKSRIPLPQFKSAFQKQWRSGTTLKCMSIHDELENVRTYKFSDPAGGNFQFKAGQHISLALPLPNGKDFRTFTIASSPTQPDSVDLTVKTARPDGGTAWMHEHLKPGTELLAFGPIGHFCLQDNPCDKVVLISAGSGITPMISMLRWLSDRGDGIDITFLHYVQNPKELLFPKELRQLDCMLPNLHLYQIPTDVPVGKSWTGLRGLVEKKQLTALLSQNQTIFCCGPAGFMTQVRTILVAVDFNFDDYHEESFGVATAQTNTDQPSAMTETLDSAESVVVNFEGKKIVAHHGQLLLDVLRQNKVVVPTGCKNGICGTCRLKKTHGDVHMQQQGGLHQNEEDQGFILACCSTLASDLSLVRD